jgi:ABC-type lipoprotein release transport system permease subunit
MPFFDILRLALRNLREAKLRSSLTTVGVLIGVAVIVTMVSFGLGLQRNTVERFRELDLFNEITVYGRSVSALLTEQLQKRNRGGQEGEGGEKKEPEGEGRDRRDRDGRRFSGRSLDDAAIDEIGQIPGVAYVEPNVSFRAYVRVDGVALQQSLGGARVPNKASRFQKFSAGRMIGSADADEAIVDSSFLSEFGMDKPEEAVGKTVELLAPPAARDGKDAAGREGGGEGDSEGKDSLSFFGIPLEGGEGEGEAKKEPDAVNRLVARSFKIVGVLQDEVETAGGRPGGRRRFRGLMPESNIYVPLAFARDWNARNRDEMQEVALELARASGVIGEGEAEGYPSATVRVNDPVAVQGVIKRLNESDFNAFSLLNELDEIRKVFLVINSALGLLGGISLLVASFGIANTMIMSIFERTREIGIMKAIGAEDREIKLIFFFEAAVIGLLGGVLGSLAAWAVTKLANQLVFTFLLEPQGTSFIDFFSIPPWLWLGSILFAMLVAILAALYPSARAARIDPVKALRHD